MDIIIFILVLFYICSNVLIARNEVAFHNRDIIINAIYEYELDCYRKEVNSISLYSYMESYEKTMCRFWDFGYQHILPPEQFALVEPYIRKGERK